MPMPHWKANVRALLVGTLMSTALLSGSGLLISARQCYATALPRWRSRGVRPLFVAAPEDDAPEELYGAPMRELTRRFVRVGEDAAGSPTT